MSLLVQKATRAFLFVLLAPLLASCGSRATGAGKLTIRTVQLPEAKLGQAYQTILEAEGGTRPYVWTTVDALPDGITFNEAGELSGVPTATGFFPFTVRVEGSDGLTAEKQLELVVTTGLDQVTITTTELPPAKRWLAYNTAFHADGGTPPYVWTTSGPLPDGIELAPDGKLGGVPAVAGTFEFTVQAEDTTGLTAAKPFQLQVSSGPTFETVHRIELAAKPTNLVVGDISGDGLPDIVVQGVELVYFENVGSMLAQEIADVFPLGITSWNGGAVADINQDNRADLVLAPQAIVLIQGEDGAFTDQTDPRIPGVPCVATRLIVHDFTGDGAPDIFQAYRGASWGILDLCDGGVFNRSNRVFINDGTGYFSDETETRIPPPIIRDGFDSLVVDFADVNGDGYRDVIIGSGNLDDTYPYFIPDPIEIYLDDGTGTFSRAAINPDSNPHTWSVVTYAFSQFVRAGDINGNGTVDLLVGTRKGVGVESDPPQFAVLQETTVFMNSGGVTFTAAPPMLSGSAPNSSSIFNSVGEVALSSTARLIDLNLDGVCDLILGGEFLLLNDGTGRFGEPNEQLSWTLPEGMQRFTLYEAVDFDADGDIDIVGTAKDEDLGTWHLVLLQNTYQPTD